MKTRLVVRLIIALISSLRFRQKCPPKPCVVVVWHEDIFAGIKLFSFNGTVSANSPSEDVDKYVLPIIKHFQITPVRISSSKPYSILRGLRQLSKQAKNQRLIITADGSRGPRRQAKPGAVLIAQRQAVPLYACRFSYKGYRIEKTWDKMKVPFPFGLIKVNISEPIMIAKDADVQEETAKLTKLLAELGDD